MCRLEQITEQPALQKRRTGCFDSIGYYLADGFICCAFFHARMAFTVETGTWGSNLSGCSLLRIGVVGVDIGISGFGSRSRLSGILPEHFGQFDASFRDGGTLGQMMDQP